MKMIRHQAIRMNLPFSFATSLGQSLKETFPIHVILEDGFTAVPTIHHMVNRAWILDSQLAGHAEDLPWRTVGVNKKYYNSRD